MREDFALHHVNVVMVVKERCERGGHAGTALLMDWTGPQMFKCSGHTEMLFERNGHAGMLFQYSAHAERLVFILGFSGALFCCDSHQRHSHCIARPPTNHEMSKQTKK